MKRLYILLLASWGLLGMPGCGGSASHVAPSRLIVVLGSSTAYGYGAYPVSQSWVNRYRAYAQSLDPNVSVTNLAVPAYTTYHLLPTGSSATPHRPAPDAAHNITAALALKPDAIIINLSYTDESYGFADEEIIENLSTMARTAEEQGVPVWLTTPRPDNGAKEAEIRQLLRIREWTERTFGARSIDVWGPLANADGTPVASYLAGDHAHLNNAGHAVVLEKVMLAGVLKALGIR